MPREGRYLKIAGAYFKVCPRKGGILRMQEQFEGYAHGWAPLMNIEVMETQERLPVVCSGN